MEMAHRGVLMQMDLYQHATPCTEETARFYFRQIVLGIEYCNVHTYKLFFACFINNFFI